MSDRGKKTQARLLEVATHLFGERGFAAVSTREIATAAETTLPSIAHHFGSKEGLYEAVLAAILAQMQAALAPISQEIHAWPIDHDITQTQARDLLRRLLAAQAKAVLGGNPDWTALIMREQLHPLRGLETLDTFMRENFLHPLARVVGILTGQPATSEGVRLRSLFLLGRVMSLRATRSSALSYLGWSELTAEKIDAVVALLDDEIRMLFPIPDRTATVL